MNPSDVTRYSRWEVLPVPQPRRFIRPFDYETEDAPLGDELALTGLARWALEDEDGNVLGTYPNIPAAVGAARSIYTALSFSLAPTIPDVPYAPPTDTHGGLMNVHLADKCEGRGCSVHHPSDHHMAGWPKQWRPFHRYYERTCAHGIGHPDPDDLAYQASAGVHSGGVHGCDGCCTPPPGPQGDSQV